MSEIDVVAADKHKRTKKLAEALQALWDLKYGGEHELNEVWPQAQRAVESFQDDYVLQLANEEIEELENRLFAQSLEAAEEQVEESDE